MKLQITGLDFENEIVSLVKAFFPNKEIEVFITKKHKYLNYVEYLFEDNELDNGYKLYSEMTLFPKLNDFDTKLEKKNYVKKRIYMHLSKLTKIKLSWGTLTGIRPTKLTTNMLLENKSETSIKSTLKKNYIINDDKINLSLLISKKEIELINKYNLNSKYNLYINIPICNSKCDFCSFGTNDFKYYPDKIDIYVDTLINQLELIKPYISNSLNTIYIGGGTPSILNETTLEKLLKYIDNNFKSRHEFTFEAGRPDSLNIDKLNIIKSNHIDRISINPQTSNNDTLKALNRKHTFEDIVDKYYMARSVGSDNINMDIIVGLYKEDENIILKTVEDVINLNPESITIHSLAVKRAAKINNNKSSIKNANDLMNNIINKLLSDNYNPYYLYRQKNIFGNLENIGFSKENKECLYNIVIIEELSNIIGIGAGATSKIIKNNTINRLNNPKDINQYLNSINSINEKLLFNVKNI